MRPGDYYYVQHKLVQSPDGFSTINEDKNSSTSLPNPTTAAHGDYFWNEENRTMTYIVKREQSRKKRTIFDDRYKGVTKNINFRVFRCYYNGCVAPTVAPVPTGRPGDFSLWSSRDTWQDDSGSYNIPQSGDNVIIPSGMWLLVDTDTPSLATVFVYGVLEFEDTMDHHFTANIIFIQGGTVMAGNSETEPFAHQLTITLRGSRDPADPDNKDMPMPYGTPNVGWKAIGVFGRLNLFGQPVASAWVKLAATAPAGNNKIKVLNIVNPSSWFNKTVMITTSGKDVRETEIRRVVAVSGSDLTLDSALTFQHLGAVYPLGDGSLEYMMASEVGLLTRNSNY